MPSINTIPLYFTECTGTYTAKNRYQEQIVGYIAKTCHRQLTSRPEEFIRNVRVATDTIHEFFPKCKPVTVDLTENGRDGGDYHLFIWGHQNCILAKLSIKRILSSFDKAYEPLFNQPIAETISKNIYTTEIHETDYSTDMDPFQS